MEILTGLAKLCDFFLRRREMMKYDLLAELLASKFYFLFLNINIYFCARNFLCSFLN